MGGVITTNSGCAKITKSVIGRDNNINICCKAVVRNISVYIRGDGNKVHIGESCVIGKNCSIRIEGNGCSVVIGSKTTMTRDCHLCVQEDDMSIVIGEDCMFSNNITIRTSDSHPIYDENGVRINPAKPVKIGSHVWFAPQTSVFKGVTIGDSSIVGSKTLVTKDIDGGCLCAGIPAKIIKRNVRWTRESLF